VFVLWERAIPWGIHECLLCYSQVHLDFSGHSL
jgi:hypothetical protein